MGLGINDEKIFLVWDEVKGTLCSIWDTRNKARREALRLNDEKDSSSRFYVTEWNINES